MTRPIWKLMSELKKPSIIVNEINLRIHWLQDRVVNIPSSVFTNMKRRMSIIEFLLGAKEYLHGSC